MRHFVCADLDDYCCGLSITKVDSLILVPSCFSVNNIAHVSAGFVQERLSGKLNLICNEETLKVC